MRDTELNCIRSKSTLLDRTKAQPPEILARIFKYICNEDVSIPPLSHGCPWILGHVCSRWRQVLWNIASIWKKIVVSPNYTQSHRPPPAHFELYSDTLESILLRTTPLISLTTFGLESFIHLWGVIRKHHYRFYELSLVGMSPQSLYGLLHGSTEAFPALKTFSTSIGYDYRHEHFPHVNNGASSLLAGPNIRSVSYKMRRPNFIPSLFGLSWVTIEEIHVRTMELPPQNIYDIWKSAPALISCSFRIKDTGEFQPPHEMSLLSLKSLKLDVGFAFDLNGFLAPIVVPMLESLAIGASPSQIRMHTLIALVNRSCCSIQKLALNRHGEYGGEIPDFPLFLKHLPHIDTLDVSWSISPSTVKQIYDGDFPSLAHAKFSVRAQGFYYFLDILDSYVDGTLSPKWSFRSFEIRLYEGPGFAEGKKRYLARYEVYQATKGLSVCVYNGTTGSWIRAVPGLRALEGALGVLA